MRYIRINKHHLHLPYLLLGGVELGVLLAAVYVALMLQLGTQNIPEPLISAFWWPAVVFAGVLSCCTLSMGTYIALVRDGFINMVFRTLVSFCLLGSLSLLVLYLLFPAISVDQGIFFRAVVSALVLVFATRAIFILIVDSSKLKRKAVIFGAGQQAKKLIDTVTKDHGAQGVELVGCIVSGDEAVQVNHKLVIEEPESWVKFVKKEQISEIIVAPDERRRSMGGAFPLDELLNCKLYGLRITDALGFYERELTKIEIDHLHPGWMLFSDGFRNSKRRVFIKRLFDLVVSLSLLAVLLPFMLLTAIAVFLESGGPVLYRQMRVGLNGKEFPIYKFRSMRQDAEKGGKAIWAQKNDSRVTKVGAFIRNTRLDELPQLYNVIAGHMSFVGPRPERPEFVAELEEKIPFYGVRHRVKPGLMGWAQLNYPYGASVEDAANKLRYDLYYTKNHSTLMDLLIMIQTVEVVLLGKGVH